MEIINKLDLTNPEVKKHWIPLYSSEIACGLFGISEDYVDDYLSLDEKFLKNKNSTFFVRASGDSMEPEIKAGDILIVDRSLEPEHQSIVALFYNGSPICKKLEFRYPYKRLVSLNNAYEPITIKEDDEVLIFGVVIGLARDLI